MPIKSANPEVDNWHGVQDPKKRKQIQDRLAQRARRKRLAEASKAVTVSNGIGSLFSAPLPSTGAVEQYLDPALFVQSAKEPAFAAINSDIFKSKDLASLDAISGTESDDSADEDPYTYTPGLVEHLLISTPANSVHNALYINGRILGLVCSQGVPARSLPAVPDTPFPLRPSKAQLETIHHTWIDRFPFVRFRDNFIIQNNLGHFDEEEFIGDLFGMQSFSLDPGSASWDPAAWKIGKDFHAKWGWLFFLRMDKILSQP